MPYKRVVRLQTALLGWHDITLLEGAPAWSSDYRAASPRMLLPQSKWIEYEISGRRFVGDALRPLWLTPDHAYRMRQPWTGQRSVALILGDAFPGASARRPALSGGALMRLWRCARALDLSEIDALELEEQLVAFLQDTLMDEVRTTPGMHRAIERAREFIASRPEGGETLGEIGAAANCSPFHLVRQFRRVNGIGLHRYRALLRMSLALRRMREGERDFSRLAQDLGFSSHSHFSASFRKTFGISPREARTNLTAPLLH